MSSDAQNIQALVSAVRGFCRRGWTPATSSNFSVRSVENPAHFQVTRSGIDKEVIEATDLLLVDAEGKPVANDSPRPSAETLIHAALYAWDPNIGAVYHTHSACGTALSLRHKKKKQIRFEGLEILKGFDGIKTHESVVDLPLFPNTQDMPVFSKNLKMFFAKAPKHFFGFHMIGHGLYTWGRTPFEAKRHLEVWEYLFEVWGKLGK